MVGERGGRKGEEIYHHGQLKAGIHVWVRVPQLVPTLLRRPWLCSAGRAALPVVDAPGIGRLSGAICFDMDFPGYLRQAGGRRADLLLQPSNTWGPIGAYHFADNALRAVEGGFTHVRCSSGGFSGVATPFYSFVHRAASLNHRALSFSVPLRRAVWTPYAHGGFLLEWAVAGAAVLLWGVMAMPRRLLERHLPRAAARLLWPVQSEPPHEEPPATEEGRPLL